MHTFLVILFKKETFTSKNLELEMNEMLTIPVILSSINLLLHRVYF